MWIEPTNSDFADCWRFFKHMSVRSKTNQILVNLLFSRLKFIGSLSVKKVVQEPPYNFLGKCRFWILFAERRQNFGVHRTPVLFGGNANAITHPGWKPDYEAFLKFAGVRFTFFHCS